MDFWSRARPLSRTLCRATTEIQLAIHTSREVYGIDMGLDDDWSGRLTHTHCKNMEQKRGIEHLLVTLGPSSNSRAVAGA